MWEIHVGRKFAITYLEKLNLHPARRLELSRMFQIHDWVEAAVKSLLETPFRKLDTECVNQIGFNTYVMLCKTKEALEYERKLTAHHSPPMAFVEPYGCRSHKKCEKSWREIWWKRVGKKLLHPDNPLRYSKGMEFMGSMDWGAEISSCCKEEMIESIRTGWVFSSQSPSDGIIQKAVDAVVTFNKSLE